MLIGILTKLLHLGCVHCLHIMSIICTLLVERQVNHISDFLSGTYLAVTTQHPPACDSQQYALIIHKLDFAPCLKHC